MAGFLINIHQRNMTTMEMLKKTPFYIMTALLFVVGHGQALLAQATEESPPGTYPLNLSPVKVFLYIILPLIVIIIAFRLMYRPKSRGRE